MSFLFGNSGDSKSNLAYHGALGNLQGAAIDQGDLSAFLSSSAGSGDNQRLKDVLNVKTDTSSGSTYSDDLKQDITDPYNSFLGWIAQKKATDSAHAEYVNQIMGAPGRQSTLFTGLAANAEKQILGAPVNPNKTPAILGG